MYKNNFVFYPSQIYANLNFENIKENLKITFNQYQDYGSIIVLQASDFFISVNSIGKLQLFCDSLEKSSIDKIVGNIECEFQKQVNDFKVLN